MIASAEVPDGWAILSTVFDDTPAGIGVALLTDGEHTMLGLCWHAGDDRAKPWQGHATGYFLVPFTFAAAIGRSLVSMKLCGSVVGFHEEGFQRLVAWLTELEALDDALCY